MSMTNLYSNLYHILHPHRFQIKKKMLRNLKNKLKTVNPTIFQDFTIINYFLVIYKKKTYLHIGTHKGFFHLNIIVILFFLFQFHIMYIRLQN